MYDDTVAYQLLMVSRAVTPAVEDIRSFVQYDDLVYAAAGSGGILTYRVVGDVMEPVLELSLTNLYSDSLEPIYIRTVEILESLDTTYLVFAYDTISGGGIGVAEIEPDYTKPLGTLKTYPSLRIRQTRSSLDPDGTFRVMTADEHTGIMTYTLTFSSNSYFEQEGIAGLVDYVSYSGIHEPSKLFSALEAPMLTGITNISQLTNLTALQTLIKDKQQLSNIITNIPFVTKSQIKQLENILSLDIPLDSGAIPQLDMLGDVLQNDKVKSALKNSALDQFLSLEGAPQEKTDTLFEEALRANTSLMKGTDILSDMDSGLGKRYIGNVAKEIEKTIQFTGKQYYPGDDGELKERLMKLKSDELHILFASLFNQANLAVQIIPLFMSSGVDIRQLYQLLKEEKYEQLVNSIDVAVIAEILRLLPRYEVNTIFSVEQTNVSLKGIRNMIVEDEEIYAALGKEGFAIINRFNGEILHQVQRQFSEVEDIFPFELRGKSYIAIADRLDGMLLYRYQPGKTKKLSIVSRIPLVGEAMSLYPVDDIIWLADGSNGILGIRVNEDESLTIEAETYTKDGVAQYIGSAVRREVLASYGSDGLMRFRITNLSSEELEKAVEDTQDTFSSEDESFADQILEWSQTSRIALFLRKLFF